MKNLKITIAQTKKIGLLFMATITFVSCTPNDPNGSSDGNPNQEKKLISINSDATGNACNSWDLQKANLVTTTSTVPSFANVRTADNITSPAVLLAQTTMTWQSSAYDNVNKKYAVSLGESVVVYDLTSTAVSSPITYNIAAAGSGSTNFIIAMEYVGGQLYVIHNNEIKKFTGGVLTSLGITLPASGVSSNTMSNMTKNGSDIYFILKGKLYTFNTTSLILSTPVAVSGWSADIDYNGLEYYAGRIYCAKRFSSTAFSTTDKFVSIDFSGNETIIPVAPYLRDWSRISSAVDLSTGIYYLSSSNGFNSNLNTMSEIDLVTYTNNTHTVTGYQFGLQLKD